MIIYDSWILELAASLKNEPSGKASIGIREQIVLPLLTIQQYALKEIQKLEAEGHSKSKTQEIFEKIVTRSLFGNINASRNSAWIPIDTFLHKVQGNLGFFNN